MTEYLIHLAVLILIWSALGLAQGVMTGYLGLLTIHLAASWGIGAYVAALLYLSEGIPIGITALPAAIVAGTFAMIVGRIIGHARSEDQVAASLCIQIIVVELMLNLKSVTNGPLGLSGIDWGGGEDLAMIRDLGTLIAATTVFAAAIITIVMLRRTMLPQQWMLIRDDHDMAESLGIDSARARSIALFISAAIAGAAGSIYAHHITFIDPQSFGLAQSVAILTIAIIGRAPFIPGVIIATMVLLLIPEALRFLNVVPEYTANIRQILFGLFLVLSLFLIRRSHP